MSDRPERDPRALPGGEYLVDVNRRLPDAGGGLQAFAATRRGRETDQLTALRVERHAPARQRHLTALTTEIDGLLTPLASGPGPAIGNQGGWYVICRAPPGPPVASDTRPWPEPALIDLVLRPIAAVLDHLQAHELTHRAIRPNNVFRGPPNSSVTLGAAWAAPPAMHQPAVSETVYAALCHPAARGDGGIANDVYALGVLLVTLATGRVPMAGLDDKTVMTRKLELGDFAAVAGNERLPPMLTDLVRGMLAEDPEHRPPPALLRDPFAARGRRVAARPASRAQKPFTIGSMTIWNSRTLALAMAMDPMAAITAIQGGTLTHWLRRGLGDSGLAVKLEELLRQHAPDLAANKGTEAAALVMRAVMDADPFMPLCWRGLAIFPDGLGTALAAAFAPTGAAPDEADPDVQNKLREIVANEIQAIWSMMENPRAPVGPFRQEAKQRRAIMQIKGPAGGLPRLAYTLNPLVPCFSQLFEGKWIGNVAEMVPALNDLAAANPNVELLDPHVAAFIGARSERRLDAEAKAMGTETSEAARALTRLRLLSELQRFYHPAALKGLTAWVAIRVQPLVERWQNRERRAAVEEKVKSLAALGHLEPILTLLEDPPAHEMDSAGLSAAMAELERLDAELRDIEHGSDRRSALASRLGQEVAAGIGLAAVAITMILAAVG
jgi:hypothetical protein